MVTLQIKYPSHTRRIPVPKGEGAARILAHNMLSRARVTGERMRITVLNSNERTMHKSGKTFSDMLA